MQEEQQILEMVVVGVADPRQTLDQVFLEGMAVAVSSLYVTVLILINLVLLC